MDFKNIEAAWVYAKKKCPSYCKISNLTKTGLKSFDITIPHVKVTKFPEDCAKSEDLEFTLSDGGAGVIELFCENSGIQATLTDTSDFADIILATIGIKESLNESDQVFYQITKRNFDSYGISNNVYIAVCDRIKSTDFYYANRFNNNNVENKEILKFYAIIKNLKAVKVKLPDCTELRVYKTNKGFIIIEEGISKFDEGIYIETKLYDAITKINESELISIESNTELNGFDTLMVFAYTGIRLDLEKQLKKLNKPYFLEVYPTNEAGIYIKKSTADIFKGFIHALRESLNEDEVTKTTGKLFFLPEEVGTMGDHAVQNALDLLATEMSKISDDATEESIVAYKKYDEQSQTLKDELAKRGVC